MQSRLPPAFLLALVLLTLAPFGLFSVLSVRMFEARLLPEVEAQTINASVSVQRRVNHAIAAFGGLHTLRGVEPVLEETRASLEGMDFLVLTDRRGGVLHVSAEDLDRMDGVLAELEEEPPPPLADLLFVAWERITGRQLFEPFELASRPVGNLLVTSLPLGENLDRPYGFLHAGVSTEAIDSLARDLWFDTATVVLALALVTVELLLLIYTALILRPVWMLEFLTARLSALDLRFAPRSKRGGGMQKLVHRVDRLIRRSVDAVGGGPKRSELLLPEPEGPRLIRSPAVGMIRLPLFVFLLAEAILRPILPQFLGEFAPPGSDPESRVGQIMAAFMAASLVSVLIGSIYSERWGARRVFCAGALLTCAGVAGHLYAQGFGQILLMRALTGFGYGLVYAAAQVYIAQHSDRKRRSSGFSLFFAVVVVAEICGPALGGILADRLGDLAAMRAAAAAAGASALLCVLIIARAPPDLTDAAATPGDRPEAEAEAQPMGPRELWSRFRALLLNMRFAITIVCFAIPAKALLTGGLFLLVPLAIVAEGGSAADSARAIMAYGIAILLVSPVAAPQADRWLRYQVWVAAGCAVAAIGFILPYTLGTLGAMGAAGLLVIFVGSLLFGVGQTLSIPTQLSFLFQLNESEAGRAEAGTVLGAFRFLERLGSLAGPLVASGLLLTFSAQEALMWMGIGAGLLAAVGMSWFLAFGEKNEREAIRELLVET